VQELDIADVRSEAHPAVCGAVLPSSSSNEQVEEKEDGEADDTSD
jgi:hypothetical protein